MEKIRLETSHLAPGMKLAEPISNASGITLMPEGVRLTPMFIARIKKWGIQSLDVYVETSKPESNATSVTPRSGTAVRDRSESQTRVVGRDGEEHSEKQEEFARGVAADVSRLYVNLKENPLMMALRIATIRRLVAAGPYAAINQLRRGPQDNIPLPEEEV